MTNKDWVLFVNARGTAGGVHHRVSATLRISLMSTTTVIPTTTTLSTRMAFPPDSDMVLNLASQSKSLLYDRNLCLLGRKESPVSDEETNKRGDGFGRTLLAWARIRCLFAFMPEFPCSYNDI